MTLNFLDSRLIMAGFSAIAIALILTLSGAAHAEKAAKWENFSKPSRAVLQERLDAMQFDVTQNDSTEPPYRNRFWNQKTHGIYVDIISGEPLFSSRDKYDSGTGWPSFTRPLAAENLVEKSDWQFFIRRTELRSTHADNHLGHVFNDGPAPSGLRYCINSAALRFIPVEDMAEQGYGEYLAPFHRAQLTNH